MINQFVQLQSMLFSYNNNALFIGSRLATPQMLVPQMAKARMQLFQDLFSNQPAPSTKDDLKLLTQIISSMNLSKDVAYEIARLTKTRS
tara:strand:- start:2306 stop:2572 length:267 start_codon:yes stop_codon:yes gene_type:complete